MKTSLQIFGGPEALTFLNTFSGSPHTPSLTVPAFGGNVYDLCDQLDPKQRLKIFQMGHQLATESEQLSSHGSSVAIVPGTQNQWIFRSDPDDLSLGGEFHYIGPKRRTWNELQISLPDDEENIHEMHVALARENRGRIVEMSYQLSFYEGEVDHFNYTLDISGKQLASLKHFLDLEEESPMERLYEKLMSCFGIDIHAKDNPKPEEVKKVLSDLVARKAAGFYSPAMDLMVPIRHIQRRDKQPETLIITLQKENDTPFAIPEPARALWDWAVAEE